ncbi:MAG: chemotaxis protein CheC [Tissierellia bacterium]|nr:chemotaxis protein CheC [Tissierellia bacterium]
MVGDNLNTIMLDVLGEIGNIGSGNAVTALASMLSKRVDMSVPQVKVLEFKDAATILGGEEKLVAGIYLDLHGDVEGNIMFILDIKSAINLTDMLLSRESNSEELDDMAMSALSEVGNILASSYVNSLSAMTNLTIAVSVPSLAIDMAGAILSVPAIQFGQVADQILFIETMFAEGDNYVKGNLFLLPDMDSFEKILSSLGVL